MRALEYIVPAEYDGRKLLHFLRGGAGCSYSLVRSLKTRPDGILRNGAPVRTIDRVAEGDRIRVQVYETAQDIEPQELPVPVLYEDADVAVFNKPSGMACHPAKKLRLGTLANVFAARYPDERCHILNRLDRDTTGAVLVAKNAFAAAKLSGQVRKVYLAGVSGRLDPPEGVVDAPIGQPDRTNPRRCVCPEGQRAVTGYRVLEVYPGFCAAACTLGTGRTHQIRVHMAYLGHPLVGDALYGGEGLLIGRQALHCARLVFVRPSDGQEVQVQAPLPEDMQILFGKTDFSY